MIYAITEREPTRVAVFMAIRPRRKALYSRGRAWYGAAMNRAEAAQRPLSLVLAYAFGTHFFLGSIQAVNALGISYTLYYPRQIRITIVDPQIDLLAWVASIILASALLILNSRGKRAPALQVGLGVLAVTLALLLQLLMIDGLVFLLFAVATVQFLSQLLHSDGAYQEESRLLLLRTGIIALAYFAVVEIASGLHYVVRAFDVNTQVGRAEAAVEQQLSYSTYSLIPWLYVGFLFSWLWIPLVRKMIVWGRPQPTADSRPAEGRGQSGATLSERLGEFLNPVTVLALALAFFVGYYPYFQNPPWLVGTDSYWRYFDPLTRMTDKGVWGGVLQSLKERHPVPLALMYAAQLLFRTSSFEVVRAAPSFLVAALGLAAWWFLGRGKGVNFGVVVFLFSVLSVYTTVGVFASILANWMALIVWILFFAYCAFRADSKLRALDVLVLFALSTIVLFLHPWSWGVFAASVLVAGVATLALERKRGLRVGGALISVIVADAALALLSLTFLAGSEGWRIAESLDYSTRWIRDPASLVVFWDTVTKLVEVWSPFFSSLYLALSILGVYWLYGARLSPMCRHLILAWIFVSGVGSVLVSPIGFTTRGESQIWRVFFLTPFQLAAPFGVEYLARLPGTVKLAERQDAAPASLVATFRWVWLGSLLVISALLALLPDARALVFFLLVPLATIILIHRARGGERTFLSAAILLILIFVVFSSTARALAQLLLSPHAVR